MFGIPDMAWLVTFGITSAATLMMFILAKSVVASENKRVIKRGKDEPMTDSEIKRNIKHHRFFFVFLFALSLANFIRYIDTIIF